jgi:hypothetical protein
MNNFNHNYDLVSDNNINDNNIELRLECKNDNNNDNNDNNDNNINNDIQYKLTDNKIDISEMKKIKEELDKLDINIKNNKDISIDNKDILNKLNKLTKILMIYYNNKINNKNINNINLPKLTKIDNNNNIRIWWIEIKQNIYNTYSSIENGKIRKETNCGKEKNINKKNYINEIQDSKNTGFKKWKDKISQGMILYYENIISKMKTKFINKDIFPLSPMLAVKYTDKNVNLHINNILNNNKYIFIQPKYDGCRCIATYNKKYKEKYKEKIILLSRGKKEWKYLYNVRKELNILFNILKKILCKTNTNNILSQYDNTLFNNMSNINFYDIHFDGELYIHGKSREYLNSIISKKKNISNNDDEVKYVIYDFIDIEILTYELRFKLLFLLQFITKNFNFTHIDFSCTFKITNFDDINKYHNILHNLGYEGLIIRNPNGIYHKKICYRSKNLVKFKLFFDAEFPIIGAHCGSGKHSGCIIWEVINKEGVVFSVTPEDTISNRQLLYKKWLSNNNLYINKLLTVKFLKYNDNGVPEVATGLGIRLLQDI